LPPPSSSVEAVPLSIIPESEQAEREKVNITNIRIRHINLLKFLSILIVASLKKCTKIELKNIVIYQNTIYNYALHSAIPRGRPSLKFFAFSSVVAAIACRASLVKNA
jgi:hypothetical protein